MAQRPSASDSDGSDAGDLFQGSESEARRKQRLEDRLRREKGLPCAVDIGYLPISGDGQNVRNWKQDVTDLLMDDRLLQYTLNDQGLLDDLEANIGPKRSITPQLRDAITKALLAYIVLVNAIADIWGSDVSKEQVHAVVVQLYTFALRRILKKPSFWNWLTQHLTSERDGMSNTEFSKHCSTRKRAAEDKWLAGDKTELTEWFAAFVKEQYEPNLKPVLQRTADRIGIKRLVEIAHEYEKRGFAFLMHFIDTQAQHCNMRRFYVQETSAMASDYAQKLESAGLGFQLHESIAVAQGTLHATLDTPTKKRALNIIGAGDSYDLTPRKHKRPCDAKRAGPANAIKAMVEQVSPRKERPCERLPPESRFDAELRQKWDVGLYMRNCDLNGFPRKKLFQLDKNFKRTDLGGSKLLDKVITALDRGDIKVGVSNPFAEDSDVSGPEDI